MSLAVVFGLIGCASKAPVDETVFALWLDDGQSTYPQAHYLVGFGSGPSPDVAADRARADLAKTLQVQIQSHSRLAQTSWGSATLDGFEQRFEQLVLSRSEAQLEGVWIAKRFWEQPRATHHALAVLDRAKASALLATRRIELQREIDAALGRAAKQTDGLLGLRDYYKALKKSEALDVATLAHGVIDPLADVAFEERQRARKAYEQQIGSMVFALDGDAQAVDLLSSALSRAGFALSFEAPWRVDGSLRIHQSYNDGWHRSLAVLQVRLFDRHNQSPRHTMTFLVQEWASQAHMSHERALHALDQKLHDGLLEALIGL